MASWRRSGAFNVNFELISYLFLGFLLLTLNKQMLAGWPLTIVAILTKKLHDGFLTAEGPKYVSVDQQ